MMKFPSTFDDESLLTYEVSDEALETAGGKEIAGELYPWVLHGLV